MPDPISEKAWEEDEAWGIKTFVFPGENKVESWRIEDRNYFKPIPPYYPLRAPIV